MYITYLSYISQPHSECFSPKQYWRKGDSGVQSALSFGQSNVKEEERDKGVYGISKGVVIMMDHDMMPDNKGNKDWGTDGQGT